MKLTEEEIYNCIVNYWEDDYLMIGEHGTKNLIKDVLSNRQPNIRIISGGHSHSLTEHLSLIVSVSALLIQGVQFYYENLKKKEESDAVLKLLYDSIKEKVVEDAIDFDTFKDAIQHIIKEK